MSYNKVTIISIILTATLVMPLLSFSGDRTVPGAPFQVLQDQIDDLRSMRAAYSTRLPVATVIPNSPVVVMPIALPAGDYVSNISLSLQYGNTGFDANCWAYCACYIIDFDTEEPFPAMGVGGNVAGILTHSATYILELEDDTNVALKCSVESELCWYDDAELTLGSGSWTLIKVEHQ